MFVRRSISARTTQQDVAFVFRQLVDVALRALSPGINDPTTAQEALVHIGSLLRQLLEGGLGRPEVSDERGRRVMRPYDPGTEDYVNLAFDQIRPAGTGQPSIAITVLEVIGTTLAELERAGTNEGVDALRPQARLTIDCTEAAGPLPEDLESGRATARRWDLA